jgi:hypothetical protein
METGWTAQNGCGTVFTLFFILQCLTLNFLLQAMASATVDAKATYFGVEVPFNLATLAAIVSIPICPSSSYLLTLTYGLLACFSPYFLYHVFL